MVIVSRLFQMRCLPVTAIEGVTMRLSAGWPWRRRAWSPCLQLALVPETAIEESRVVTKTSLHMWQARSARRDSAWRSRAAARSARRRPGRGCPATRASTPCSAASTPYTRRNSSSRNPSPRPRCTRNSAWGSPNAHWCTPRTLRSAVSTMPAIRKS